MCPKPRYLTPNENAIHIPSFLESFLPYSQCVLRLDEAELGGSNVQSINIRGEAGKGLLGAVRAKLWSASHVCMLIPTIRGYQPDQSIDLDGVDVIEFLQGLLDLGLVGLDIDDEDESVLLLDLLQGALSVERVNDDLVLIEARLVRDRLARILGGAREDKGLRAVEGGRLPDLGLLVRVHLGDC